MKYWLVFMLFDSNGEFIRKYDIPTANRAACIVEAGKRSARYVNMDVMTQSWCVTDDHHSGRKQDPGIPYD